MASDIQQTPFIKQLAANGALSLFISFYHPEPFRPAISYLVPNLIHKMKPDGRELFFLFLFFLFFY